MSTDQLLRVIASSPGFIESLSVPERVVLAARFGLIAPTWLSVEERLARLERRVAELEGISL